MNVKEPVLLIPARTAVVADRWRTSLIVSVPVLSSREGLVQKVSSVFCLIKSEYLKTLSYLEILSLNY